MKAYNISFIDAHLYPELNVPTLAWFDEKPCIGETVEINENHFLIFKIVHQPLTNKTETGYTTLLIEYA